MQISKKPRKDCLDCMCVEMWDRQSSFCQLNYDIKDIPFYAQGVTKPVPLEPCPKPRTGNEWLFARKSFMKNED